MEELTKKIERIFLNSTAPDELFDSFTEAIKNRISDLELYKILLANSSLSADEIKMYSEKLLKELPQCSYHICLWTAKVFESQINNYDYLENSFLYYTQAALSNPTAHEPIVNIINLYNTDIDLPINNSILEFVDIRIPSVHLKSKVYFALAEIFKRTGNKQLEVKCLALGEKSAKRECGWLA